MRPTTQGHILPYLSMYLSKAERDLFKRSETCGKKNGGLCKKLQNRSPIWKSHPSFCLEPKLTSHQGFIKPISKNANESKENSKITSSTITPSKRSLLSWNLRCTVQTTRLKKAPTVGFRRVYDTETETARWPAESADTLLDVEKVNIRLVAYYFTKKICLKRLMKCLVCGWSIWPMQPVRRKGSYCPGM